MKLSTKDKVEGKLHQASGKVKEVIGKAIDNHEMQIKGKAEKLAGEIQTGVGKVEATAGK